MTYKTAEEILDLVQEFEQGTLSESEWTHSNQLIIRLYYCLAYPFDEALTLMRGGIYRFEKAHPLAEPANETVNIFWMIFIKQFVETAQAGNLAELANQVVAIYEDEELPLRYYSAELLASPNACKDHICPDLDRFYLFVNSAQLLSYAYDEITLN